MYEYMHLFGRNVLFFIMSVQIPFSERFSCRWAVIMGQAGLEGTFSAT